MRQICMSGSMSGVWKQSHGRTSEAPPDERGGNRYVRPTATAPHSDSTHGRALRSMGPNGRCGSRLCENSNDRQQSINFSRFSAVFRHYKLGEAKKFASDATFSDNFPSFHTAWVEPPRSGVRAGRSGIGAKASSDDHQRGVGSPPKKGGWLAVSHAQEGLARRPAVGLDARHPS